MEPEVSPSSGENRADRPDLRARRPVRHSSRSGSSLSHSRARGRSQCAFPWTSAMTAVGIEEIGQIANGSLEDRWNKSEIGTGGHNPYVDINNVLGPVGA